MNKEQIQFTKEAMKDMRGRIDTLERTIIKMEESGKFEDSDPRFEKMQDDISQMEKMLMKLGLLIGDRPCKMEHPSLDDPQPKNIKGV